MEAGIGNINKTKKKMKKMKTLNDTLKSIHIHSITHKKQTNTYTWKHTGDMHKNEII